MMGQKNPNKPKEHPFVPDNPKWRTQGPVLPLPVRWSAVRSSTSPDRSTVPKIETSSCSSLHPSPWRWWSSMPASHLTWPSPNGPSLAVNFAAIRQGCSIKHVSPGYARNTDIANTNFTGNRWTIVQCLTLVWNAAWCWAVSIGQRGSCEAMFLPQTIRTCIGNSFSTLTTSMWLMPSNRYPFTC